MKSGGWRVESGEQRTEIWLAREKSIQDAGTTVLLPNR